MGPAQRLERRCFPAMGKCMDQQHGGKKNKTTLKSKKRAFLQPLQCLACSPQPRHQGGWAWSCSTWDQGTGEQGPVSPRHSPQPPFLPSITRTKPTSLLSPRKPLLGAPVQYRGTMPDHGVGKRQAKTQPERPKRPSSHHKQRFDWENLMLPFF